MKRVIMVLSFFVSTAYAQKDTFPLPSCHNDTAIVSFVKNGDTIFYISDTPPEFIGGHKALYDFIKDNLRFPKPNLYCNFYGTVYIGFIVTKEGRIEDVKVKRGIGIAFNDEAIRLVKLMDGKWKAGKQNGQFVDVNYTLPIKFTFE